MIRTVVNDEHLEIVLGEALTLCRRRMFIATADLKDLHLPAGRRRATSFLDELRRLSDRSVEIRLLHSGVPSGPLLARLKLDGVPANLTMRLCPRMHAKAIIVDGRWMYLGSANLTGAGIGAKSARRRNFEAGIWTDEIRLIDPVADMLEAVWEGEHCPDCGRTDYCPVPLEEPEL